MTPALFKSEDDEALRDLVRAREDAKEDELRAKHRLSKFLLRNDIHPPYLSQTNFGRTKIANAT